MTLDEAIVMKQFEWYPELGEDQAQRYRCPLHVAFKDHSAPVTEQRRRNCEYRFQVSIGAEAVPKPVRNGAAASRL